MANVICLGCGHIDDVDNFVGSISVYSDMRCPKCGTTEVDTSEVNKEWAARGEKYGYGDDNSLNLSKEDGDE